MGARGGRRGPMGRGQGRAEREASGAGRAAPQKAGGRQRVRIAAAATMSLSNKLTLDKVDVKGKRVVMR